MPARIGPTQGVQPNENADPSKTDRLYLRNRPRGATFVTTGVSAPNW